MRFFFIYLSGNNVMVPLYRSRTVWRLVSTVVSRSVDSRGASRPRLSNNLGTRLMLSPKGFEMLESGEREIISPVPGVGDATLGQF